MPEYALHLLVTKNIKKKKKKKDLQSNVKSVRPSCVTSQIDRFKLKVLFLIHFGGKNIMLFADKNKISLQLHVFLCILVGPRSGDVICVEKSSTLELRNRKP